MTHKRNIIAATSPR